MPKKDYYKMLEVDKKASDADIKKAFRKLARKYHPDVNPNNEEAEAKFKEINEAYEVLGDTEKRKQYDTMGDSFFEGFRPSGSGFEGFSSQDFENLFRGTGGFEDIFGGIFGRGGARRAAPQKGEDLKYRMEIDLEEVVTGKKVDISFYHSTSCTSCGGSGEKPGGKSDTCSRCGGSGNAALSRGFMRVQQTCPACNGAGRVNVEACSSCGGKGEIAKHEKLSVKIPAGADNGSMIRLAGKGNAGRHGGPSGDLYIETKIRDKAGFKRDGRDITVEALISVPQAILGDTIEVSTIDGKASMKIPKGTQNGQKFRLKGKGLPPMGGGKRGEQYVLVTVNIPKNLDGEAEDLVRALGRKLRS
ncbi:MAG: molecular chaperone DnaJ [Deltaproteobacteria bacterium]|nr:molecular chaperone DnaJ [Deltaproteobacteria bacterium]